MKQLTQERTEVLLKEYDEQRGLLKDMVQDLEKIKVKIETLLPERLDARLVRFFEEKVKSISMLFQIILDISFYNHQGIPQIVTIASNPAITNVGSWTYRLCLSDTAQAPAIDAARDVDAARALDRFAATYHPGSFGRRPPDRAHFDELVAALDRVAGTAR